MNKQDLLARAENDVVYHAPTPAALMAHTQLRGATMQLVREAVELCPMSRELVAGVDKLVDEVLVLFNAAVARNHDQLDEVPSESSPSS